jgi:hypothetical protein
MNHLFIDTNIIIHFKALDEIKWSKLIGGRYQFVFAPVILTELDKHKNNTNSKIAKRAKNFATKLVKGNYGSLPILLLLKRPVPAIFVREQLDPGHQDDCLIASILQFKEETDRESKVFWVTDDSFAQVRAGTYGIEVLTLSEELRVDVGKDEELKEIEKLKKEIAQLKGKVPNVTLRFPENTMFCEYKIPMSKNTYEEFRRIEMTKVKLENPLMEILDMDAYKNPALLIFAQISALSNRTRIKYNEELTAYYGEYEKYLQYQYIHNAKLRRLLTLSLILVNDGNTPAEDIDIKLHLSNGFEVLENAPEPPVKPKLPHRPKNDFDFGGPIPILNPSDFRNFHLQPTLPDPGRISIKKTNGYEINCHCQLLKHNLTHDLNPIFVQFESEAAMKSFQIEYKLNISNVPYPVEEKLNVIVKAL